MIRILFKMYEILKINYSEFEFEILKYARVDFNSRRI